MSLAKILMKNNAKITTLTGAASSKTRQQSRLAPRKLAKASLRKKRII